MTQTSQLGAKLNLESETPSLRFAAETQLLRLNYIHAHTNSQDCNKV